MTLSTWLVSTSTSRRTLGTNSTVYSAPRNVSVLPPWRPYPWTSLTVRPRIPAPRRASFTSSSLKGLMMAVTTWGIGASDLLVAHRSDDLGAAAAVGLEPTAAGRRRVGHA